MKLYYSDTLNPRKACAVARHLQLPVEFIYVTLGEPVHGLNGAAQAPSRDGMQGAVRRP